jgi:hypothetical protein
LLTGIVPLDSAFTYIEGGLLGLGVRDAIGWDLNHIADVNNMVSIRISIYVYLNRLLLLMVVYQPSI